MLTVLQMIRKKPITVVKSKDCLQTVFHFSNRSQRYTKPLHTCSHEDAENKEKEECEEEDRVKEQFIVCSLQRKIQMLVKYSSHLNSSRWKYWLSFGICLCFLFAIFRNSMNVTGKNLRTNSLKYVLPSSWSHPGHSNQFGNRMFPYQVTMTPLEIYICRVVYQDRFIFSYNAGTPYTSTNKVQF